MRRGSADLSSTSGGGLAGLARRDRRKGGKTGGARVRMGAAIEPRCQPIHMDRRSSREVWQARFRQAPVATLTYPKGAAPLRKGPCNPCPFVILGLPRLCAVLLPDSVEELMLALGAQCHMAWCRLRFGT